MPVSVIVGGQYGSEGKGKVALEQVRRDRSITTIVRPGGTNSGHTGYTQEGKRIVLRQLPAAAIDGNVKIILPAGSYVDVDLLKREIDEVGLSETLIAIDPRAHVIRPEHLEWERRAKLNETIGSTGSGTGGAVISRMARYSLDLPPGSQASETPELLRHVQDTGPVLRQALDNNERILIEGTQGFGLSPIHGDAWPKCTSRDSTAAAFLSETGLGPLEVDEVVLVIRCHPIRVAGDSGPLAGETDWQSIALDAGAPLALEEFTSVTKRVRRVGHFEGDLVRRAIAANSPTKIVLNHLDYVDWRCRDGHLTDLAHDFIRKVRQEIGRHVDMVGTSETSLLEIDREILV